MSQSSGHYKREAHLRAKTVRRAANACGLRRTVALVAAIGDLAALGPLPHPSQATLARELHAAERTVRGWSADLEAAGLVEVRRSRPRRGPDGQYTRSTNRYVLCDWRAARALKQAEGLKAVVTPSGRFQTVTSVEEAPPRDAGAGGPVLPAEFRPQTTDPPDLARNLARIADCRAALAHR